MIAFNKNLFEQAHDYFIKVDKIDNAHETNVRILLLKCIYEKEQDYNDATLQSFLSTKVFFKRNTSLTEPNKKAFSNFVIILIELYKYKLCESNKSIDFIKDKLHAMQYINNKVWLLNKLSELEKM